MKSDILAPGDAERISVLQAITEHQSLIFGEAVSALSKDPEKSLQKSSKLYINHHFPSFCGDMLSVLKHISVMMFEGYPSRPHSHRSISVLKRKYIDQGVPVADVIKAIESLREITLDILSSDEQLINLLSYSGPISVKSEIIETIPEIKKRYSHMWVAIEVVDLEKGFPKSGKVILASKSRNTIAEEISKHYSNVTTYTFYCSSPNEEEDPVRARISEYLDPYFDSVVKELGEAV
ncbi:hypothetical protein D0962_02675 [Leptolyngbyaceae cyanobacterium CCMR0082]|uniref:Uncharacterized protein n=1 Tax=Adonisia turfae CCMR0082 TaxID=2304604 RepID=A0A6M0S165_9CYAN|nr:hypothetical protein [Adonisia turfae]NEZ61691.1 hypothetical protein [Adonisia turfae CCMR0082]